MVELNEHTDNIIQPPHTPLLPVLQSYVMTSSPRGLALVISNVTFDPHATPKLSTRNGGEVDEEVLRKLFADLDYAVTVRRNLTAEVTPSRPRRLRLNRSHK